VHEKQDKSQKGKTHHLHPPNPGKKTKKIKLQNFMQGEKKVKTKLNQKKPHNYEPQKNKRRDRIKKWHPG